MADALSFLEEDLTCSVCCDVFTEPVTLKCSHSLCEKCLQKFWSTQTVLKCPVCRKECTHDEPTKSLAFKALCEAFKTRKPTAVSEDICQEHKEKLKLFCYEDKRPICVVCYTSKQHENHKCSPVEEAVGNLKEDLKSCINSRQVTLTDLQKVLESCVEQDKFLQECSINAENEIKREFEKLHQFLREEEEKQIRLMQKELEPRDVKIKGKIEKLSRQISDLSEKIAAAWQDMEAENITFLQHYNKTLKSLHNLVPNTSTKQEIPNTPFKPERYQHPIHTMNFTTWARLQNLLENPPVTLDPNTASNKLLVSWDCCSVRHIEKKLNVSDNPERLYVGVLAAQGFSSGIHCWDVEVADNDHWTLGVVGETVDRKKLFKMDPKSRFWCFRYVEDEYRKGQKKSKDIDCDERPCIIRVQLDFDGGELKFIDPFRNRVLCSFTGGFPEKVYPYFCTGDLQTPLNLFPSHKHHG